VQKRCRKVNNSEKISKKGSMKSYKFSYKPPLFEKHRIAVNLDDIRNQLPRNNHKKMNKKKLIQSAKI